MKNAAPYLSSTTNMYAAPSSDMYKSSHPSPYSVGRGGGVAVTTSHSADSSNHHRTLAPPPHNSQYYVACYFAGGLSSGIRWILSPMELVKTRLQTAAVMSATATVSVGGGVLSSAARSGAVETMWSTMASIYAHEGGVRGLLRGLGPTAAAYWFQTSTKYSLYEILKDQISATSWDTKYGPTSNAAGNGAAPLLSPPSTPGWVYVVSAATAEAVAVVLMCPWEMVKVKLQTTRNNSTFPSRFGPALAEMMRHRRAYNFPFGSLGPLWGRQVPGTIANFYTFEHTAQCLYAVLGTQKSDCTTLTQLSVTYGAGQVAGVCCAVVTHPADSLLSYQAVWSSKNSGLTSGHCSRSRFHAIQNLRDIVRTVGWYRLATRGLATRMLVTGQVIAGQWLLYDTTRSLLGCKS
jgi:solute carrier family 25 (mitochondrial phosphate transporter), member 3